MLYASEDTRNEYLRNRCNESIERDKIRKAAWYIANKARILVKQLEDRRADPGKYRERRVALYWTDPEKSRAATKKWVEENKEKAKDTFACIYKRKKEVYKKKAREWKAANPERTKELNRQSAKRNLHTGAEKTRRRLATKLRAVPKWANLKVIKGIYLKASQLGLEVDHIVPLQNSLVCGLHCESNLQLLSASENRVKHNSFVIL